MFCFDLKDGYHHILIHKDFRDYLGFKLELDGVIVYCRLFWPERPTFFFLNLQSTSQTLARFAHDESYVFR